MVIKENRQNCLGHQWRCMIILVYEYPPIDFLFVHVTKCARMIMNSTKARRIVLKQQLYPD